MIRFRIVISLMLLLTNLGVVNSQDSEIHKKISELLKVDGMLENHLTIVDRTILGYSKDLTQIPESFWKEQHKIIKEEFNDSIQIQLIKIYTQYLSPTDIDSTIELIKANNTSELSKSYIQAYQESMILAKKLTAEISQKLNSNIENSSLINHSITQLQCEEFKNGEFINIMGNGTKVQIEKIDSIQFSRIGDNFIKFKIEYINECDYSLEIIETNFNHLQGAIGSSIEIYPYEVENSTMRYKSIMKDDGFVKYGEITLK